MNRITATGRPVKDCVISPNTLDKPLCKFILACKGDYVVDNEVHTDFIRCVAWDKTAEFLINNVKKGDLLAVAGTLTSRKYENHETQKEEIVWEIKVERVEILARTTIKAQDGETKAEPSKKPLVKFEEIDDDNLPF